MIHISLIYLYDGWGFLCLKKYTVFRSDFYMFISNVTIHILLDNSRFVAIESLTFQTIQIQAKCNEWFIIFFRLLSNQGIKLETISQLINIEWCEIFQDFLPNWNTIVYFRAKLTFFSFLFTYLRIGKKRFLFDGWNLFAEQYIQLNKFV